jgi:hypothetical protein
MTDKARGHEDETIGEYVYGEASGFDRKLLGLLDLSAEDFAEAASSYGDAELTEWIRRTSGITDEAIRSFNDEYLGREPADDAARERLQKRVEQFAPERTDIRKNYQAMELDDWGSFREVDLTKRAPRSPYCRDGAGIYAVARMADKARADRTGKLNDYIYDCPIDKGVLGFLGISAEAFQNAAWENPNDVELSAWVRANSNLTSEGVTRFNATIATAGPTDDGGREFFNGLREKVAPGRIDITTWFELLDLDDEKDYGVVDLSRHAPRSPFDTSVGGVFCLARLIDKGRATGSDTLGPYFYGEDSGLDRAVLAFFGVTADNFRDALPSHKTDGDVLAWMEKNGKKSETETEELNNSLNALAPTTDDRRAWLKRTVEGFDPARSDVTTFLAFVQLDDRVTWARHKAGV